MTATNDLQHVAQRAHELNPTALLNRLLELERGGLPARNNNGSRSRETPLPLPDRTDQHIRRTRTTYLALIRTAARALDQAHIIEQAWIPPAPGTQAHTEWAAAMARAAVELISPRAVECANCHRPVQRIPTDRLISGRCKACYEYRHQHMTERPRQLWERDTERKGA